MTRNLFVLEVPAWAGRGYCSKQLSLQLHLWRQFNVRSDFITVQISIANIMDLQSKMRLLEKINQVEGELLEHVKERFENLRAEVQDIAEDNNQSLQEQPDQTAWEDIEVFEERDHGARELMFMAAEQQQAEQIDEEIEQQQLERSRRNYYRNGGENAECHRLHYGEEKKQCILEKGLK